MKELSNIAKIGDAALLHVFPSFTNKKYERTTEVHKESVDIFSEKFQLDGQKRNYLYVWGIEKGLVKISIHRVLSGTVGSFLRKQFSDTYPNELDKFSHFVLVNEFCKKSPYVHPDGETVNIYRIPKKSISETAGDSVGPQIGKWEKCFDKALYVIPVGLVIYLIIRFLIK